MEKFYKILKTILMVISISFMSIIIFVGIIIIDSHYSNINNKVTEETREMRDSFESQIYLLNKEKDALYEFIDNIDTYKSIDKLVQDRDTLYKYIQEEI